MDSGAACPATDVGRTLSLVRPWQEPKGKWKKVWGKEDAKGEVDNGMDNAEGAGEGVDAGPTSSLVSPSQESKGKGKEILEDDEEEADEGGMEDDDLEDHQLEGDFSIESATTSDSPPSAATPGSFALNDEFAAVWASASPSRSSSVPGIGHGPGTSYLALTVSAAVGTSPSAARAS